MDEDKGWTMEEAIELVRDLEPKLEAAGFHCALHGSVLIYGGSMNDLDLIVYPHCSSHGEGEWAHARRALMNQGLKPLNDMDVVHAQWKKQGSKKQGSDDRKIVQVWMYGDKKVDVFFLQ